MEKDLTFTPLEFKHEPGTFMWGWDYEAHRQLNLKIDSKDVERFNRRPLPWLEGVKK